MAGDKERKTFYKVVPGETSEDKATVLEMIPFESKLCGVSGGVVSDEEIRDLCEGRCDNFVKAVPGKTIIWCTEIKKYGEDIQAEAAKHLYCTHAKVGGVEKTLYDKRVDLRFIQ